jgi:single-stranded DNA-binding protein
MNRVTLIGKLLDDPRVRSFETRNGMLETVSLWIELVDDGRSDRFSIDITCPKQGTAAKAMRKDVIVEIVGKLRHDRWKNKEGQWTGKVFVAIEPGAGTVRSKGLAKQIEEHVAAA